MTLATDERALGASLFWHKPPPASSLDIFRYLVDRGICPRRHSKDPLWTPAKSQSSARNLVLRISSLGSSACQETLDCYHWQAINIAEKFTKRETWFLIRNGLIWSVIQKLGTLRGNEVIDQPTPHPKHSFPTMKILPAIMQYILGSGIQTLNQTIFT